MEHADRKIKIAWKSQEKSQDFSTRLFLLRIRLEKALRNELLALEGYGLVNFAKEVILKRVEGINIEGVLDVSDGGEPPVGRHRLGLGRTCHQANGSDSDEGFVKLLELYGEKCFSVTVFVFGKEVYPFGGANHVDSMHLDPSEKEDAQSSLIYSLKHGVYPPLTFGSSSNPEALALQTTKNNIERWGKYIVHGLGLFNFS
ncbi:hypothetical protein Fmac_019412 [Flemingia macrophylla]|uniref:Uncharacterized protein n=1 Tax=Flemingia macrophylla TaxID=520843 RepID=A0ABD1M7W6_9FABA